MDDKMTEKVIKLINVSSDVARAHQNNEIDVPQFLLALYEDSDKRELYQSERVLIKWYKSLLIKQYVIIMK